MKELATLLLKSLSSTPDNVVVEEKIEQDGCIIKAVRTVLNAAAAKQNKKVTLKLED